MRRWWTDGRWLGEAPVFDGRHLWVASALVEVGDPANVDASLGAVLVVDGPICHHCGNPWPSIYATRACPGPIRYDYDDE